MYCHREMVTVRAFYCPEKDCLFSGRSPAELRVHQNTHSNEKHFCCTIDDCDYRTKTNALLNRLDEAIILFLLMSVLIHICVLLQTYQITTSKWLYSFAMSSLRVYYKDFKSLETTLTNSHRWKTVQGKKCLQILDSMIG